jgi:hyperosmotically inducible protein
MNNSKIASPVLMLAALAIGVASIEAHAFGTANDVDTSGYSKSFKSLDTDNDGTLTRDEASKEELFAKHFKAADTNHDGKLTEEEYTKYRSAHEKNETKRVMSDSWITSKVKAALIKDEGMKGMKVSVKTFDGMVQLSGFVDTEAQIKQAEKVAAGVEGVKSVKNSLVLKKQ